MILPEDLNQVLEKQLSKIPRASLMEAAADLTRRYRCSNRDQLPVFMTSDEHRLAYLAVRMPATYAVVKRVMQECKQRMPEFSPASVCDVGAGPGTATWAAMHIFPEISTAVLHEKDAGWLKLGKELMNESAHLTLKNSVWHATDLAQPVQLLAHDMIILSYVVGELSHAAMNDVIAQTWNATSQVLVIIEPGTPHGFERIRQIRDQLIQLGAFLVAPCPHHNKCPMTGDDWCHFAQRLERSSLHRSVKDVSLGYEDEKYSYIVASRTKVELPEARLLRHPQHHSGHSEFVLCAKDGLEKRTISRRYKDLYKKAKKLNWGDSLF